MKITFKLTHIEYNPSRDILFANVERCDDPGHEVDERYRIELNFLNFSTYIRCLNENPGDAYVSYPSHILHAFCVFFENLYDNANLDGTMAPDECLSTGMTFDFEA